MYTTSQKKQRHNKKDYSLYNVSLFYIVFTQTTNSTQVERRRWTVRMSNLADDKELSWPSEEKAGIRTKVNQIK